MAKKSNAPYYLGAAIIGLIIMSKSDSTGNSANKAKFMPYILVAEKKYNLMPGLLEKIAFIESRFNPDAIGPLTKYGRAIGIMQIMPKFHPDINPKDPIASIDYAAKFLRQLYEQFKDWKWATAAYNAGGGNIQKVLAGKMALPAETANYIKKAGFA